MSAIAIPPRQPSNFFSSRIDRSGLGHFITDYYIPVGARMFNVGWDGQQIDSTANNFSRLPQWSSLSVVQVAGTLGPHSQYRLGVHGAAEATLEFRDDNEKRQRLGVAGGGNPIQRNLTKWTAICIFDLNDLEPDDARFYSKDNGTGESNHTFMFGMSGGDPGEMRCRVGFDGNRAAETIFATTGGANVNYNVRNHMVVVRYDTQLTGLGGVDPYECCQVRGDFPTEVEIGGGVDRTTDLTLNEDGVMLGATFQSDTNRNNGEIRQIIFFDGHRFSNDEIFEFYWNPWQFLSEPTTSTFFIPTGGAIVQFAGSISASLTMAINLHRRRELSGAVSATTDLTADLHRRRDLTGAIAATADLTVDLHRRRELTGAIASIADLAGDLHRRIELTGAIAATADLAGDMHRRRDLAGTIVASIDLVADLHRRVGLSGSVVAGTIVTGDFDILGSINLTGAIVTSTVVTGDLHVRRGLVGNISAPTDVSGSLGRRIELAGAIVATAGVAGDHELAVVVVSFTGSISAPTGVVGGIDRRRSLAGSVVAPTAMAGQFTKTVGLRGGIVSTAVAIADFGILGFCIPGTISPEEVQEELTGTISDQEDQDDITGTPSVET